MIQIFSGGIFPLDIFGATWLAVFDYLPFKYTIYMPVNLINGKLTLLQALHVIELQLLWIGLLLLLTRYIWTVAIKKYIAVGVKGTRCLDHSGSTVSYTACSSKIP